MTGTVGASLDAPSRSQLALGDLAIALAAAGAIVTLAFLTSAGSDPSAPVTGAFAWPEIAATVLGAGAIALAVALGARARLWGATTVVLLAAFTAFAALSIAWSVAPDLSWYGADGLVCCLSVLAGTAALARTFPGRWRALVGAIAIAATALGAWALLVKVFPGALNPLSERVYGRLQAPFGYWNAVGLAGAMGLPACLWAAARRQGPRAARAAAVAGMTVGITVVVLSYSRSAVLAAVLGLACSFALGRRRLPTALLLGVGALGAVPIVVWGLHAHSLTGDGVPLAAQETAGQRFGVVLVVVLALTAAAGWLAVRETDRRALPQPIRPRVVRGIQAAGVLAVVAVIAGLSASHRGLTGEISHAFHTLTSSTSSVGLTSGRLTQLGSSRPVYWHEGIEVGAHHLLAGAGELGYAVARLRYTTNPDTVHQAHSWLVQTFSDLGLIGLALTLALLVAWSVAAARPLGLLPAQRSDGSDSERALERDGMVALAAIVVCFGVQSALDWTFYFLGVALPALA
ncbi:MAG: O-antigen ligase family protein, partial [Solirubrobacteraceae bacterium]